MDVHTLALTQPMLAPVVGRFGTCYEGPKGTKRLRLILGLAVQIAEASKVKCVHKRSGGLDASGELWLQWVCVPCSLSIWQIKQVPLEPVPGSAGVWRTLTCEQH